MNVSEIQITRSAFVPAALVRSLPRALVIDLIGAGPDQCPDLLCGAGGLRPSPTELGRNHGDRDAASK